MTRRLQVTMSVDEEKKFRKAAKLYNISAAEWARRILRKAADRDLAADVVVDPLEAVRTLGNLNAPIDTVATMKRQSTKGRLT